MTTINSMSPNILSGNTYGNYFQNSKQGSSQDFLNMLDGADEDMLDAPEEFSAEEQATDAEAPAGAYAATAQDAEIIANSQNYASLQTQMDDLLDSLLGGEV